MKKILLFAFALVVSTIAEAQLYNNPILKAYIPGQKNTFRHRIDAGGSYELSSTGITNQFFNKYLYDNFFDSLTKQTVLNKLNDNNRFGAHVEQYLFYTWRKKNSENTGFFAQLRNRRHYGSAFTNDAFGLLFFGNARYAGKTANLDGSGFYRNLYHTLQFGMYTKSSKNLTIGGGIGIARGTRYMDFRINKGSLYTSQTGDSLALYADAETEYANLKGNGNRAAGIGALANIFAVYDIDGRSFIQLSANDLGFLHINKFAHTYQTKQQVIYTGIEVNTYNQDFNSGDNRLLPEKLYNHVDSAISEDNFTVALPAQIHLQYKQYLGKKTAALLGVEYYVAAKHIPAFHFNISQEIAPWLALRGGVNLLGYSKIGVNVNASATFAKSWFFNLGSDHIEGLLAPKNTFGQGAYVSLGKGF